MRIVGALPKAAQPQGHILPDFSLLPWCPRSWNGGAGACLSAWPGALSEVTWVNIGVNGVAMLGKAPTVRTHPSGAQ